jgi:hypothetical protein
MVAPNIAVVLRYKRLSPCFISGPGDKERRIAVNSIFAWPGFCHRLIGDEPKVSILPVRPRFDIVDDSLRPLQVGHAFRRTKQLGVVIQCVENFEGPNASPGEETGVARKKILAAAT